MTEENKENIVDEVVQTEPEIANKITEPENPKQKEELLKIEEAFRSLGIIVNDENKRVILDYTKTISNFRKLLDEQKNHYTSLQSYIPDNDVVKAHIQDLDKNWEKISSYFEALMSFFINPPSKEIFELTNHALLLKNVYNSFKEFSEKFEKLHIKDQFDGIKVDFEGNLKVVKDFQNKLENNLENMAKTYDEFLSNFLKKQTKELNKFNDKSQELAKSYDDFLHKNLKFFKGGTWSLIILNIALAIGLGALVAVCFVKSNELENLIAVGKKFAEISVIKQDENSITLNFPLDAEIINNDDEKKVILK